VALLRRSFPLEHFLLDLVRENSQVTGEAVEQLALGFVRGSVSDQGALGGISTEFF